MANTVCKLADFPLIQSTLEQRQRGLIFRQCINGINTELIIHRSGFGYFLTDGDYWPSFIEALKYIGKPNLPQYFHLYCSKPMLNEIDDTQVKIRIRKRVKWFFEPSSGQAENIEEQLVFDHSEFAQKVKNAILNFWPDIKEFEQQVPVGSIYSEGQLASVCYPAAISKGVAEIDIMTNEKFLRQGFARMAGQAFLRATASQGLLSSWDCFDNNLASMQLAEKLGFTQHYSYDFASVFLEKD